MNTLKLDFETSTGTTLLSNTFIDTFLPQANGEFVKIYIYLLRCASGSLPLSVSLIADKFNNTEADVIRAIKYWEKMKLLKLEFNGLELSHITFLDISCDIKNTSENIASDTALQKAADIKNDDGFNNLASGTKKPANGRIPSYSADKINEFKSNAEISELLFVTSAYLGKTLSATEMNAILYFYEELKFPTDLIEYLVEYCVSKGSKSIHYIQTVAFAWADENITTKAQAVSATNTYNKNVFTVFNEFKIKGRSPIQSETDYINKWVNDYSFTLDIVKEACRRTVLQTSKADFRYCDSILTKWHEANVHHLSDINKLDEEHKKNNIQKSADKNQKNTSATASKNKFNNFQQRSYDYNQLEKELLNIQ